MAKKKGEKKQEAKPLPIEYIEEVGVDFATAGETIIATEIPKHITIPFPEPPEFVKHRYTPQDVEDFRKAYAYFVAEYNEKRGK